MAPRAHTAHSHSFALGSTPAQPIGLPQFLHELERDEEALALASDVEDMTAPELATKLHQGQFTSVQLTKACLLNCLRADVLDNSSMSRVEAGKWV
jgi:hypothetical protein